MLSKDLQVIGKLLLCIMIIVGTSSPVEAQGIMAENLPNGIRVVLDTRGLSPQYPYEGKVKVFCRDRQGYPHEINLECRPVYGDSGMWEATFSRPVSCFEFLRFGMGSLVPQVGKSDMGAPSWSGPVKPIR